MRLKTYKIYAAGGSYIASLYATCITVATEDWINILDRPAIYELDSREQARVRYSDNHCVMGDFVILLDS